MERPKVAIVGSKAATPYGQRITTQLAAKLAEREIVIVRGLATRSRWHSPRGVSVRPEARPDSASLKDVLHALELDTLAQAKKVHRGDTTGEQALFDILYGGTSDAHQ